MKIKSIKHIQEPLRVMLGSLWGHSGIILDSLWAHFEITVGSYWEPFIDLLGIFWETFLGMPPSLLSANAGFYGIPLTGRALFYMGRHGPGTHGDPIRTLTGLMGSHAGP